MARPPLPGLVTFRDRYGPPGLTSARFQHLGAWLMSRGGAAPE
jgi:hypothetical protein